MNAPTVPYPIDRRIIADEAYDVLRCKFCDQTQYVPAYGEGGRTRLTAFPCEGCGAWLHMPNLRAGRLVRRPDL